MIMQYTTKWKKMQRPMFLKIVEIWTRIWKDRQRKNGTQSVPLLFVEVAPRFEFTTRQIKGCCFLFFGADIGEFLEIIVLF